MTKAEVHQRALQLPETERFGLAEELWASLTDPNAVAPSVELPQWQKDLLDERIAVSADDPGQTWEEVKAEIWPTRA
jgi:putative addiction module component (TIGR02574 family)